MDPNLERKLSSPENLYASSPAFQKGVEDVERLATERFKTVVDKLRQVKGMERLTPNVIQRIYMEEMSKVPMILRIESQHREELEELAKDVCLDETETPEDWYQIEAMLNREPIDVDNFRYEPEEPEDEDDENEEKKQSLSFDDFDIENLTPQEEFELEKHKRNIINALVQGAAKKGHYLFQKPEVKTKLDAIDSRLYPAYLGVMAVNDLLYFTMEQMIEHMSATGNGVAGKVSLEDADDKGGEGEEDSQDKPDTKIVAEGLFFPILCHEIIKGIKKANARFGLPKDPQMREKVKAAVDVLSNEPMQLRLGPPVVEKLRFALPDEMFLPENKGLINWFEIELYQIPNREFLQIFGDTISKIPSKVSKAKERYREIMKKAMELKKEYEDYLKTQKKSDDSDIDDDDSLDDFLSNLGISRPK
jgi:hypothetical protein